jgi:cytochrome P450
VSQEGTRTTASICTAMDEEIAVDRVGAMAAAGPPADLAGALAAPLSITAIGELLGIPQDERRQLRRWADTARRSRQPRPQPASRPRRFDRRPNPHLAFGHGPHRCLGVALARLEIGVALRALAVALPGLRLRDPIGDIPWIHGLVDSGPAAIRIARPVTVALPRERTAEITTVCLRVRAGVAR